MDASNELYTRTNAHGIKHRVVRDVWSYYSFEKGRQDNWRCAEWTKPPMAFQPTGEHLTNRGLLIRK